MKPLNKDMTYNKAEQLWAKVLERPARKPMVLISMDLLNREAIYFIKTEMQHEHVALRFRKAGGEYVSVRRIWYTDKVKVTVSRFNKPAKIFTDEDVDNLVKEFAKTRPQ